MNSNLTYVPSFAIKIKNQDLRQGFTVDVLSVSVTDTANQADSFSITLRDRHPEAARFAGGAELYWIDSGVFDEGNEVEIQLGYQDNLGFIFRGDITAMAASFSESGLPTLSVRGFSRYHQLQRLRPQKALTAKTVSGIAKEIAGLLKMADQVDEVNIVRPYSISKDQTFAAILKERAEPLGFEVVVKYVMGGNHTLFFQKPRYIDEPSPITTFEWGKDLRSFSPSLSTYSMTTEVKVGATQSSRGKGKEVVKGKAMASQVEGKMGTETGPEIAERIFGSNPMLHPDHDIENQDEANRVAKAQLGIKALDFITGRASVIGKPNLKARTVVELTGLGKRFSGNYYVTSVTHTIDAGGYRTEFEVKRNARNGSS